MGSGEQGWRHGVNLTMGYWVMNWLSCESSKAWNRCGSCGLAGRCIDRARWALLAGKARILCSKTEAHWLREDLRLEWQGCCHGYLKGEMAEFYLCGNCALPARTVLHSFHFYWSLASPGTKIYTRHPKKMYFDIADPKEISLRELTHLSIDSQGQTLELCLLSAGPNKI